MKKKSNIILLLFIILLVAVVCFLTFGYFLVSTPNYTIEMLTVSKQKDFIISKDIIKIPLDKYIIIKAKKEDKQLYLFKIKDFKRSGLAYEGVLLQKIERNQFMVLKKTKGDIYFHRLFASGKDLFGNLHITILPVNSLLKHCNYSYGTYKNYDIFINENKEIILPKEISWNSQ